jgi:hypothetical protein
MRKTFVRTLAVVVIVQFVVTRNMAGREIEEGRAERLWMMFPLNVLMNSLAWTLALAAAGRLRQTLRGATT